MNADFTREKKVVIQIPGFWLDIHPPILFGPELLTFDPLRFVSKIREGGMIVHRNWTSIHKLPWSYSGTRKTV